MKNQYRKFAIRDPLGHEMRQKRATHSHNPLLPTKVGGRRRERG